MRMEIFGEEWSATVYVTDLRDEKTFVNVEANVRALSKESAQCGAEWILAQFAEGRMTVFRARPESHTERDFVAGGERHTGYVRFSYLRRPGEWTDGAPTSQLTWIGMAS